jgi:hypothetical protein
MPKKRLTPKQYKDEIILRQIQVSRYATGQTQYVNSLIDELNEKIARFCLKEGLIETKGQYAECKKYIREKSIDYRKKLYIYLQKELKRFITEQSKWTYNNSSVVLRKVNIDKAVRDIFFIAYSDTDNIKSYITRIFNQIFQLWDAQLTIAYRTGQSMKGMIKLVLDKEYT